MGDRDPCGGGQKKSLVPAMNNIMSGCVAGITVSDLLASHSTVCSQSESTEDTEQNDDSYEFGTERRQL